MQKICGVYSFPASNSGCDNFRLLCLDFVRFYLEFICCIFCLSMFPGLIPSTFLGPVSAKNTQYEIEFLKLNFKNVFLYLGK